MKTTSRSTNQTSVGQMIETLGWLNSSLQTLRQGEKTSSLLLSYEHDTIHVPLEQFCQLSPHHDTLSRRARHQQGSQSQDQIWPTFASWLAKNLATTLNDSFGSHGMSG